MNITSQENIVPLTPQSYYTLLALASRPLHGYAIAQQIAADSAGAVASTPGSIYHLLRRLETMRLIHASKEVASERSPHMRKQYTLTKLGRDVLKDETDRLALAVALARHRGA